ncbi:MAG: poly-gamma-glutamate biosynthesis protein PgsC/CapC [Methylococcaceae bacterium]|nr:poly-gamma-glutamate biosynthesis protein PgsC/CapC [Methylococcaceae bacterium]
MDIFPLYLFPTGSLASSVVPAVWVGMLVVCFFNLRLGWVLSGLVVPGYLVPLLLMKPWAAAIVLLEGLLTYFITYFLSEYLSRKGPWNNLFGRDRFFALVLCSIVIRLLFDGWLLPEFGEWLNDYFQMSFDYRNHLHSFGLIIISLIANQFWKTGFVKGVVPFTITLTVTLLIVRYGLMELTNFSLSSVSYLYEDMAASILATPKAYIILVSTAFLASRMNLYYGWDFNGILIPSLLALQWYQPLKILATIAESAVILMLAILLLKTPWLKSRTIEGARKLILFLNISFVYKIVLGYVTLIWFPDVKTTDYFGFGYLLATLMAVKIHDKAILARLTRATLQTSLTAVLVASVIGFTLTLLPITNIFVAAQVDQNVVVADMRETDQSLIDYLQQERVRLFEVKANDSFKMPLATEVEIFSKGLEYLQTYLEHQDVSSLAQANQFFNQINYRLLKVEQHYLVLTEKKPARGWGIYVFNLNTDNKLALEIPAPLNENAVMEAGSVLFELLHARSLAIAGSNRFAKADKTADVLSQQQSFFHVMHRMFGRRDGVQIRTYTGELARQTSGLRRLEAEIDIKGLVSTLWIKQRIPDSLDLVKLKQLMGSYQVQWQTPDFENRQRDVSSEGFAELILNQQAARALLFRSTLLTPVVDAFEQDLSIEGYLQNWILNSKAEIAEQGSNLYQAPDLAQLLFLDEQVFTPLLDLVKNYQRVQNWTPELLDDLRVIARSAAIMGYQIIRYRQRTTQRDYLIIAEQTSAKRKYWGTYVLRVAAPQSYVVQIPRPLYDINSFEYGVSLFERINAAALMVGATHPYANFDNTADLVDPENKANVFNLFNQVLLREAKNQPLMILSSRAFGYHPDRPISDTDIILALESGVVERQELTALTKNMLEMLEQDGLKVKLLDGSLETQGYEASSNVQSYYLKATENKNFAVLWLSPLMRSNYRQQDENNWQIAQFTQLAITSVEQDLEQYLLQHGGLKAGQLNVQLYPLAAEYLDDFDILGLQQMQRLAAQDGQFLVRLIDINSKQAFILLHNKRSEVIAVLNLKPRKLDTFHVQQKNNFQTQLKRFIALRLAWLLMEPE